MKEMLLYSFDIAYVMTKFVLLQIEDLKFTIIQFDSSCKYLGTGRDKSNYPSNYIPNLTAYCKKIVPFVNFYKKKVDFYNYITYEILTKEITLILTTFPKDKRHKRGIITSLIIGFIGLECKGISNFLHYKWHNALHKAVVAMKRKIDM